MRKIVFDIETKNTFHDIGKRDPSLLDISLLAIWDGETDTYDSFLYNELDRLWPIIERADMLIGYNSDHFDIPLLNKYYPGDLNTIKSLDIMKEIVGSLGKRIRLDAVAEATLGVGKSGNGLDAIVWWNAGEVEKVREYCLQDVKVTKEIYEYALANNHLKYRDLFSGDIIEIPLETSAWEDASTDAGSLTIGFDF